ncbi:hypothetical protein PLICRDRAFT_268417 [Plicaturopsis crispa FD-325 SS-3]|nr:hypothetical protein PLICRDRAFT_268417 [Plicaturopsis crispa FD-325 SS-3]
MSTPKISRPMPLAKKRSMDSASLLAAPHPHVLYARPPSSSSGQKCKTTGVGPRVQPHHTSHTHSRQPVGQTVGQNDGGDDVDGDGESDVQSIDVAPSSSMYITAPISNFDLDKRFPAIRQAVELIRLLAATHDDVDALRAVADVFTRSFDEVVRTMEQLPTYVQISTTFLLAQHGAVFMKQLFRNHINDLPAKMGPPECDQAFSQSVDFVDMIMHNLRTFFEVAEHELVKNKPLPTPPSDEDVEQELEDSPIAESPSSSLNATESQSHTSESAQRSGPPSVGTVTDEEKHSGSSSEEDQRRPVKKSFLRDIARRPSRLMSSKASSSLLSKTTSSATLVNNSTSDIHSTTDDEKTPRQSHDEAGRNGLWPFLRRGTRPQSRASPEALSIRASLAVFPEHLMAKDNVSRPWNVCHPDEVCVRDNVVRGATLPAIVRLLTGAEILTESDTITESADPDLQEIFFRNFRIFSHPSDVYKQLVARYYEPAPRKITPAQKHVWERDSIARKVKVAQQLCAWLELYWRHRSDDELLPQIRAFAIEIAQDASVPRHLSQMVIDAFQKCVQHKDNGLQRRLQLVTPLRYDSAVLDLIAYDGASVILPLLYNDTGRTQLAQALTRIAFQLHRQMEPEDFVLFYFNHQRGEEASKYIASCASMVNAVTAWVKKTILSASPDRIWTLSCFVNVASLCLEMRNYAYAQAIYVGVASTEVLNAVNLVGDMGNGSELFADLSDGQNEQYITLKELFGPWSPRRYTNAINCSDLAAVPLLWKIQQTLCAAEEKASLLGTANKSMINIQRCRDITVSLKMMDLVHKPVEIPLNESVHKWLMNSLHEFLAANTKALETASTQNPSATRHPTRKQLILGWIDNRLPRASKTALETAKSRVNLKSAL